MKIIKIIFIVFLAYFNNSICLNYTYLEFCYIQYRYSYHFFSPIQEILKFKCPFYISIAKNITKEQLIKRINDEVKSLNILRHILQPGQEIRIPRTANHLIIKLTSNNIDYFYLDDISNFDVTNFKQVWVLNSEI